MHIHDIAKVIISALLATVAQAQGWDDSELQDSARSSGPNGLPPTNAATCIKDNGHVGDRTTQQACDAWGDGKYQTGSSEGLSWKVCLSDNFSPDDLLDWHRTCQQFSGHGRICTHADLRRKRADEFTCYNADCVAEQDPKCLSGSGGDDK